MIFLPTDFEGGETKRKRGGGPCVYKVITANNSAKTRIGKIDDMFFVFPLNAPISILRTS